MNILAFLFNHRWWRWTVASIASFITTSPKELPLILWINLMQSICPRTNSHKIYLAHLPNSTSQKKKNLIEGSILLVALDTFWLHLHPPRYKPIFRCQLTQKTQPSRNIGFEPYHWKPGTIGPGSLRVQLIRVKMKRKTNVGQALTLPRTSNPWPACGEVNKGSLTLGS